MNFGKKENELYRGKRDENSPIIEFATNKNVEGFLFDTKKTLHFPLENITYEKFDFGQFSRKLRRTLGPARAPLDPNFAN